MEIYDVVKKLTGEIDPIGETHTDNDRYANLQSVIELTRLLIRDINWVASNKDRYEYSIKEAGIRAAKFLTFLKEEY